MTLFSRHQKPPTRWRVVVATRIFSPEPAAASFRLKAVAQALARLGADVHVLTSRPAHTPKRSQVVSDSDVAHQVDAGKPPRHVHGRVRISRARTLRDSSGYLRGYLPYLSFDVPLFFRLLVRPADVALVEPPPTTGAVVRLVCALKRVPYVYYAADLWSDAVAAAGMRAPVVRAMRVVEGFALRGASAVIAINRGVADRARTLGARNVQVVLNGIDTSVFAPSAPLPKSRTQPLTQSAGRLHAPEGGRVERPSKVAGGSDIQHFLIQSATSSRRPFVVYAGTASEWQGAQIFYDAFDRIRNQIDADLVWIGQGSDMADIARRARGDSRVHVFGSVDADVAAAIQARAQVALVSVVPGKGYDFAYPTKVLAALACGTPVLFAGQGPAAEDIEHYHLGAVSDYIIDDVAQALQRMVDSRPDPSNSRRLRQWVIRHRSLQATGKQAAALVLQAADTH